MSPASKTITILALATPIFSWDYEQRGDNTSHWADLVAECGYSHQSPIDLPLNSLGPCLDPIQLQWTSQTSHYVIRNTGYSLLAMPFEIDHAGGADISGLEVLHHANDTNIRLQNAWFSTYDDNVNREYCFDSLHFHWSTDNDQGSEHTINGESYPLEVHLVHYSCNYHVAGDALRDYASGKADLKYDDNHVLAVIGVIFEIGDANPVLAKILDDIIIDRIFEKKTPSSSSNSQLLELFYTEFDLQGLLPENREIVGYQGSLTTPPCYETVRWHVLKNTMTVSQEQMDSFRDLLASTHINDSMAPNFRPPQPLNGRTIYSCLEDIDGYDESSEDVEEEEETVYYVYETLNGDDTWKWIGIALIALFGIFSFICCYMILRLYGWLDGCCCINDGFSRKRSRGSWIHPPEPVKQDSAPNQDNLEVIDDMNL